MSDEVNEFLGSSPELFQPVELSAQALNRAMLEAVEFVHAEGWDNTCVVRTGPRPHFDAGNG